MVPSQLLLVLLSLSAGGWAQSNSLSAPDTPASSARQPANTPAEQAPSSAARPPASLNTPSVRVEAPASSARPNPEETSAAVSPSAATTDAASPARPSNAAASSNRNERSVDSPSARNSGPADSNTQQSTRAVPGLVQGGTTTDTTGAAASGSPPSPGSNGTDARTGNISGADSGGGVATASPSSPGLATTVSFAAQPSDAFRNVNQSAIERIPESKAPTPPDVATLAQLHAELAANIPSKPLGETSARALAVMETAYFEYFVNRDPAPVDMGKLVVPASISQCKAQYARALVRKRSLVDEILAYVPLVSRRDLRGFENCRAVESLEVGVYFHYMRATATSERPNELESRVKAQVDALNDALGAVKINFRYMSLNWWEPKADEDWTVVDRRETKLQEWQQRTKAPGKLTLTVWVVNGLRGSHGEDLNSYATFPNEELNPNDGVVIEAEHVQGGDSTTLIHDVGHWFGLGHTFGEIGERCIIQDGLTNTTQTSGMKDVVYECSQVPCSGGDAVEINNYMSYSSCRGRTPREGFTTDQKARMFANALQFRRGYETGECMPDGKAAAAAAVRKRKRSSSMQDILDGRCPDYYKQADVLMDAPHSLGARTAGDGSSNMGWTVLGGLWAAAVLFV